MRRLTGSPPGLCALWALALSACAGTSKTKAGETQLSQTIVQLRAQNQAYARQVEELQNQVFILSERLETRPRPAAAAPAPSAPDLPEVKLEPGQTVPQPQPASTARSLLDHAEVEYAGAAAESPKKRPLLRIWAEEESDEVAFGPPEDAPRPAAITVVSEASPPAQRRARRAAAGPVPAAHEGPELEGYRRALDLLRTGRHDEAVAAFRAFVRKHTQHDYADNAQYWLGECFYDRQDYPAALREFRRVVEQFPTGNKAPDALLKVAFSHLALGQDRPGRIALTEIVRNHPRHSAAGLAAAKLAELDGIGATAAATRKQEEVP